MEKPFSVSLCSLNIWWRNAHTHTHTHGRALEQMYLILNVCFAKCDRLSDRRQFHCLHSHWAQFKQPCLYGNSTLMMTGKAMRLHTWCVVSGSTCPTGGRAGDKQTLWLKYRQRQTPGFSLEAREEKQVLTPDNTENHTHTHIHTHTVRDMFHFYTHMCIYMQA